MRLFLPVFLLMAVVAGSARAADAIPNRLGEAKVGEWVMMLDLSGDNAGEKVKIYVTEVREGDPKVVVLKRDRLAADGSVADSKDIEIPLDRYAERLAKLEEKAKQISRERLWVKDKELTVYAISWDDDSEEDGVAREFKIWVSDELPMGGIAKSWSSDPEFPAAEVIDYGF